MSNAPKPKTHLANLADFMKDGQVHTRAEIMQAIGIGSLGVLNFYVQTLKKRVPEGEALICELVGGRTIGYRWVVLKTDQAAPICTKLRQ